MPPESIGHLEAMSTFETTPAAPTRIDAGAVAASAEAASRAADLGASSAEQDAERLSMSTLSFQDYVRKRMLKRRQASRDGAHCGGADPGRRDRRGGRDAPAARLDVRLDDTDLFPPVEPPRAEPAPEPRFEAAGEPEPLVRVRLRRRTRAARRRRPARRAARRQGPDRRALRRARVHGKAAAPAGRGAPRAEAARLRLLADAGAQDGRRLRCRRRRRNRVGGADPRAQPAHGAGRRGDRRPRRRVRADRPDRRRQDDDDGQDRRRLRRAPRRRPTSA